MNTDFNLIFGKLIIPAIKLTLVLIFIFSFFAFVKLFKDLDPISLSFVTLTTLTSVLELAPIVIVMSSVFDISTQFTRTLPLQIRLVENQKSRENFELDLKACAVIRCNVGSSYYMETEAKLTIFQYLVNGTVFLMVNAK